MKAIVRSLGLVAIFVVLTTCGGGDSAPPPPVVVSISPTTASLKPGDAQGFMAGVTGSANTAVTWSVQEGAAGGIIDSNGTYIADLNNGTFHVIATSQADPNQSATAIVTVAGPFVVTPSSNVLGPHGVAQFFANGTVTWSVQEGAAGGAIDANGQYTAPSTPGMFHVVATSIQDPSKTMLANVTIVPSGFLLSGSMSVSRTWHTATLLQNGKVLVAGGSSCDGFDYYYYSNDCPQSSAEIYDPAAGTFTVTGTMGRERDHHTATLLSSGKVLVTGGSDATAELYDPASGKFLPTGSMSVGRSYHTATLLTNGQVLIVGGTSVSGALATAELYDPTNGHFTATGAMTAARTAHSATLLANGKVLIAGGGDPTGAALATAELFDPSTGSFTATNSMASSRVDQVATLLANSNVLVTGGDDNAGPLSSAEVYDSLTGTFTPTGSMMVPRAGHFALKLANGSVLVAGGGDSTAELYDAVSGTFTQSGSMVIPRAFAAAVLLQDGRVLVTGGGSQSTTTELYK